MIYMISQQLIIQCDVCSVLFTYQTNRNISRTKYEERYGKTIDGADEAAEKGTEPCELKPQIPHASGLMLF